MVDMTFNLSQTVGNVELPIAATSGLSHIALYIHMFSKSSPSCTFKRYFCLTCNQLNTFLNQVNAKQTNGQLTAQQAAELTQQAKAIQQAIGCSNVGGMLGQTNQLLNNVGPGDGGGDDNNDDENP